MATATVYQMPIAAAGTSQGEGDRSWAGRAGACMGRLETIAAVAAEAAKVLYADDATTDAYLRSELRRIAALAQDAIDRDRDIARLIREGR